MFFDVCDGIFLNYNWSDIHLKQSMEMAGEKRKHDIYVGVDVFGRGVPGGGGWNTRHVSCSKSFMVPLQKVPIGSLLIALMFVKSDQFLVPPRTTTELSGFCSNSEEVFLN